ncbi:MAG: integrase arm-type DNA-binding domain-containing protein [Campylobacter sp.]|uniref:integrase arm-type DNA-binding domain-containing protein n=1 Tax=Campylobacter sp. TaxID=205 RepID=UPI0036233FBA
MAIDILKDTQIRKAIKKEKDYSLTDGGGLAILITSKDVKRWVFYYIDPASGKKM